MRSITKISGRPARDFFSELLRGRGGVLTVHGALGHVSAVVTVWTVHFVSRFMCHRKDTHTHTLVKTYDAPSDSRQDLQRSCIARCLYDYFVVKKSGWGHPKDKHMRGMRPLEVIVSEGLSHNVGMARRAFQFLKLDRRVGKRVGSVEKRVNEKKERGIDMKETNEKSRNIPDENKTVATGFKEDRVAEDVRALLEKTIDVAGVGKECVVISAQQNQLLMRSWNSKTVMKETLTSDRQTCNKFK